MKKIQSILLPAVLAGVASVLSTGIALGDELFITNNGGDGSVSEINSSTGTVTTFVTADLSSPTGLAFNSAGDLFVANNGPTSGQGYIAEFSSSGTFIGDYATGLNNPRGIAFDSAGNLFVANQASGVITEILAGSAMGTTGTAIASGLGGANGLAFDSAGNLYVAVGGSGNYLDKITFTGNVVDTSEPIVTSLSNPNGVATADGSVFVVNTNDTNVLAFDASGNPLGVAVSDSTNMIGGHGLAIDSAGDFWVEDESLNEVSEYSSTGQLIKVISGANDVFNGPNFITDLTVPEPSAFALLVAGLGLLFFITRRKAAVTL